MRRARRHLRDLDRHALLCGSGFHPRQGLTICISRLQGAPKGVSIDVGELRKRDGYLKKIADAVRSYRRILLL